MRLAILLACAVSLCACVGGLPGPDDDVLGEPDLSASLRIPLTAEDEAGVVYRLRDVEIELSGAALLRLSERAGVRRESLVTALPAGEYAAYLRPGWRLMARTEPGSESSTEAELVSANPVTVRVNEAGQRTLQLVFKQGDRVLRFGAVSSVRVTRADSVTRVPTTL